MKFDSDDRTTLLEIYKLQAELAEQASASREGIGKLYTGMVSSIIAASVLLQRVAPEAETNWVLPVLGMVVSICWMMSLRSATGRLAAKHAVLLELESELPFDFVRRETAQFDEMGSPRRKRTAGLMPGFFLVVCTGWLAALVLPLC